MYALPGICGEAAHNGEVAVDACGCGGTARVVHLGCLRVPSVDEPDPAKVLIIVINC